MAAAPPSLPHTRRKRPKAAQDNDLPPWKRLKLASKNSAVLVDLSEFDDIDAHFVFGAAPPESSAVLEDAILEDAAAPDRSSSSGTAVLVPSGTSESNNPFLEPAPHDDSAPPPLTTTPVEPLPAAPIHSPANQLFFPFHQEPARIRPSRFALVLGGTGIRKNRPNSVVSSLARKSVFYKVDTAFPKAQ